MTHNFIHINLVLKDKTNKLMNKYHDLLVRYHKKLIGDIIMPQSSNENKLVEDFTHVAS